MCILRDGGATIVTEGRRGRRGRGRLCNERLPESDSAGGGRENAMRTAGRRETVPAVDGGEQHSSHLLHSMLAPTPANGMLFVVHDA